MPSNSENIVQDIRKEFESMLQHVQTEENISAYDMERSILGQLLRLGYLLLQLYFNTQREGFSAHEWETEEGKQLPYHGERKRIYYSIFGKLPIWRPYFYEQGVGSALPLDEKLSLGEGQYSDLLREIVELSGVEMAYEKAVELFRRLFGQRLGKQAVQQMVEEDAMDVLSYDEQKPAPAVTEEGSILVVQSDGKGVPMRQKTEAGDKVRLGKGEKRSKKKEAVVTSVYTIAPAFRKPEDVVANLFQEKGDNAPEAPASTREGPRHKETWATLEGKDEALRRLRHRTIQREGEHIQARVALTDGAKGLQQRMMAQFPEFTLILDFIHANEYLWDAANQLFSEQNPDREVWMRQRTLELLSGRTDQVIADLRRLAEQRPKAQKQLLKTANYFQRNLPHMHYDHYLAQGWPIASGVIEGACRHLVKDRLERTGMRWTQTGAESLLLLRSVSENDDWEAYQAFHRKQRHLRLYTTPSPSSAIPESEALADETVHGKLIDFQGAIQQRPQHVLHQQRLAA